MSETTPTVLHWKQCVVLGAGAGTRMRPESLTKPKVLAEVLGKPLLDYVIDYWKPHVEEFIFVLGYKKELVLEYLSKKNIVFRTVEQKELRGIAHALSLCEDIIKTPFILQLGDCLCKGTFQFPATMNRGFGVWHTDNPAEIRQSYSVEITSEGKALRVKEKPQEPQNDLCGMGTYFFDVSIFDCIRKTKPSSLRNELEITDVIQTSIDSGLTMYPVSFNGKYINVTSPADLEKAGKLFASPPTA